MTPGNFTADWHGTPYSHYAGYQSGIWDSSIGKMARTSGTELKNKEVTYNYQAHTYSLSGTGAKIQFDFDNHFHNPGRHIDGTTPVMIGLMDVSEAGSTTLTNATKAIYLKGTVNHSEAPSGWQHYLDFELVYGNSSTALASNLLAGGYKGNNNQSGQSLAYNYDITFTNVGSGNFQVDIDFYDYDAGSVMATWSETVASPFDSGDNVQVVFGSEALNANRATGIFYDTDAINYTPVPEPSSFALLAMGAFSLLGFRRRK